MLCPEAHSDHEGGITGFLQRKIRVRILLDYSLLNYATLSKESKYQIPRREEGLEGFGLEFEAKTCICYKLRRQNYKV